MDTITLKGLEFIAYHGVLESEKDLGQIFSVDCTLAFDTSLCDDQLDKTVNYGEVALEIVQYSTATRFDLIETLANELARHLLVKYPMVQAVTLTVHKPHAPIATPFKDVNVKVTRRRTVSYLAIGSNLGDKVSNLNMVSEAMEKDPCVTQISKSSYIKTKPYGITDQPDFLNGAIKISTVYTPFELLRFCKTIEKKAGRVKTRHWGERTLDVDILFYGDTVLFTENLIIPHPQIPLREFVLAPLAQIEPYFMHPVLHKSVQDMLDRLKDDVNDM